MRHFPFRVAAYGRSFARIRPLFSRPAMLSLAALACFVFSASAARAQTRYHVDAATSHVGFHLGGFHDVNGVFKVTSGHITFQKSSGKMSGDVVVSAASGHSGNSARDKKMRRQELHVHKFPHVSFKPTGFTGTLHKSGDSSIKVHGLFTLVGKPHKITVPMKVDIAGNQCTAKGTFTLPYVQWGMKDPTMLFLKEAKDVKIDVTLKGTLSEGK